MMREFRLKREQVCWCPQGFGLLCAIAIFCITLPTHAEPYDLIIRNARIIDGTGNPWFRGSVAVKDGKIADLGILKDSASAARVIDAEDHYVTPGFIDVHTHCEDDLLTMPAVENFVRMGETTPDARRLKQFSILCPAAEQAWSITRWMKRT